ncbi:MAG TPA: phenylalanine--tRNA ligase subunit beta [Gemmatimonadaceae bacterium]|nr:phenylalanine--tRNA ligase subunit beta [Gemmatimonadaceae bacterium]
MLISHDWLRAFVAHDLAPEQVRDLVSAHVATVDRMVRLRDDLRDVVVARVLEAGRHPNADTLWVTKVDDGSGTILDVVCGAPNVEAGTLYPFARTGTTLPGGVRIEKRKIRGETSNGMLCSARELGLGEDQSGILALETDAAPGTPLLEALPLGDVQYEVDVLPNRPDLLSHLGVAREVAALTGVALQMPAELGPAASARAGDAVTDAREASSGGATVRLEDHEGCPFYMGVVIRGVKVGPSPAWLAARLESLGLRPISNIVDVTNYMLHGFGQPMHAFDLSRLSRSTVVIRRARAGEPLVTLDGVARKLESHMTVIADAERAVAVAGVMGGRESEVHEGTTDVFLEVAVFTPHDVRVTRQALGLSTDASYRFERGIDAGMTPRALAIAAALITQVAGGRIENAPIAVGRATTPRPSVTLRPARLQRLLGDPVAPGEIRRLLELVGFEVVPESDEALGVRPPTWRNDVSRDADLVEEIARLRGYDVLSDEVKPFRPTTVPDHPLWLTTRRVRDVLVGMGLAEIIPLPFVRGDDATHVRVRNPLAEDEPHYRRSLLETLARRAEYNLSRMQGNVRLFEIGSALEPDAGRDLPNEELRVGALIMGARRPAHFTEPQPPHYDAWDAKGLGERIVAAAFPGEVVALEPSGEDGATRWSIVRGPERRMVGRVEPVTVDRPNWAAPAYGVELTLDVMPNAPVAPPGTHVEARGEAPAAAAPARRYRPLPTTPAAELDFALLVPDGVPAMAVERVLRSSGGELLERVALFDEYRGEHVPPGFRSVAWRLTFRDPVRTLRDKEIEGRRQKILRSLENELGVRPRTA